MKMHMPSVVVGVIGGAAFVLLTTVVHSQSWMDDNTLMRLAKETYGRDDYLYAAIHLQSIIQRNPPALRNNAALTKQFSDGYVFSARQMEVTRDFANTCRQQQSANQQSGIGTVRSGLGVKPRIDFPQ